MAFTVFLWLAATVAHFWQTARAARVLLSADASLDDRIFTSVVLGVASLSVVLHLVVITTGLTIWSGLIGLVLWHALLFVLTMRRTAVAATHLWPSVTLIERIALAVFLGIVLSWVATAAASSVLYGPDAAHYHVPNAVNFAQGISLFDLSATPHIYPIAGSVIAAWFILPTGTTLLVDLAMVLPFAMLIVALNLAFRALTGLSGTGWATWLGLTLFSTPMFRTSSAGAADLWFAAGYVAVGAILLRAWSRPGFVPADVWLLGGAAGLLVGSKTTGVAAAALLLVAFGVIALPRRLSGPSGPAGTPIRILTVAIGVSLFIGAGGVWLVRNWVQHGSPIGAGLEIFGMTVFEGETHQQTTYFSVLGEMQNPGFDLPSKTAFYVKRWFGAGFLPALMFVALLIADLVITAGRRRSDQRWWTRTAAVVFALGVGSVLIWMLIGAPWTALDRSGGLTLRYALPVAALLVVLAFAGLFPLRWPWYRRADASFLAVTLVAAASLWMFVRALEPAESGSALPTLRVVWLLAAAVIVFPVAGSHLWPRRRLIVGLAAAFVLTGVIGRSITHADMSDRARASQSYEAEVLRFEAGHRQGTGASRELFLSVRSREVARGRPCASRRFFFLSRDDEPMALQPPDMTSRIFYAGRDVETARRAGPIGPCDYVVASAAVAQTDKGRRLAEALGGDHVLEAWPATASFVVYMRGPAQ